MNRPPDDYPLLEALESCNEAMSWLNEKHDAPMRAKLYHAAVALQKAMRSIRQARAALVEYRRTA